MFIKEGDLSVLVGDVTDIVTAKPPDSVSAESADSDIDIVREDENVVTSTNDQHQRSSVKLFVKSGASGVVNQEDEITKI